MKKPKLDDDFDARRLSQIQQTSLLVTEALLQAGAIRDKDERFQLVDACLTLYQTTIVSDLAEFVLRDGGDLLTMMKAVEVEASNRRRKASIKFVEVCHRNLSHLGWVGDKTNLQ